MEFDKTGGALAQIVKAVSKIWKADGFENIRAIHGGTGGYVLNPKVVSGKAIDASTVLGRSLNPEEAAAALRRSSSQCRGCSVRHCPGS